MTPLPLVRTQAAEEDLVDIWLYVGEHNPRAADILLDELDRRAQMLVDSPLAGVARSDIAPGIRQLVEGNYLILYRITDGSIEIVRVLHARQRITSERVTPPADDP